MKQRKDNQAQVTVVVHTIGALFINGYYGCGGARPGQLALCIGNRKKSHLMIISIKKALHCNPRSILCFMTAYENEKKLQQQNPILQYFCPYS